MSLQCSICNHDRSKSGKPFTKGTLAMHMKLVHGGESVPSSQDAPLSCDLCGATESGRGKKFLTWRNVIQHKRKLHPDTFNLEGEGAARQRQAPPAAGGRKLRKTPAASSANRKTQVKFCPHCGFNLEVVHAAMEFVNGDTHS